MSKKIALITGATGQDGSYMAELLLGKGYEVHGLVRRSSSGNTERIQHLLSKNLLTIHRGDVTDTSSVHHIVTSVLPDEIYHLASQSHVGTSFFQPEYTFDATGVSALRFLETLRHVRKPIKFYQASSSEMFGNSQSPPQNENTPFKPASPYAIAKVMAHQAAWHYRDAYGIFAVGGILFNHESPRRGEEFVTRKITSAISKIKAGLAKEVVLGNMQARRDWGYAPEYMEAVWNMMHYPTPEDFVIATGETHSVEEFLNSACSVAGLNPADILRIDQSQMRPSDVSNLCGDSAKAKRLIGWNPKVHFQELVKIMVEADLKKYGVC